MFDFIKSFFNKEEELMSPSEVILVELSDVAKEKGMDNNHNKMINMYNQGRIKKQFQYTEEMLEALAEVYELPIEEMPYQEESEEDLFEPDVATEFGVVKINRIIR